MLPDGVRSIADQMADLKAEVDRQRDRATVAESRMMEAQESGRRAHIREGKLREALHAVKAYLVEDMEVTDSPGTRAAIEVHIRICDEALMAKGAH